jgi:sugar phosphate isomerase/epimerase
MLSSTMSVPVPMSRRRFLAAAGALPALAASQSIVGRALAGVPAKKFPIGIELYAVRGELRKDLPNTIRTVAKLGYEVVEFYSQYFSWTFPYAKEVRALLDDVGVRCHSTHNQFASLTAGETMAKAIELNQILGARHIVLASAPPGTSGSEGWKRLSERLAAAVEELRPHGLTAGYHNHRVEWNPLDNGQRAVDVIAANTPKDFVLQLDVGTCVEAGADPVAWIQANPGRIRSLHLKDWAPGTRQEEKSYRVLFGEGVAPWQKIFAAAESVGGVEFYLMEQEGSRYSEFETAERCMDTWKAMRKGA